MTTRNLGNTANKKPIDSLYNIVWALRNLSQVHESLIRKALYNVVVIFIIGAIVAVSVVLGPFFKPLLWAFLFGAVLYPFKRKLSSGLKSWFESLENNDTHILVGIIVAPFNGLADLGDFLGSWLREHIMILAGGVAGLISLRVLISLKSHGIFCLIWRSVVWIHGLFSTSLSSLNWMIILTTVALYFGAVVMLWKPENSLRFTIFGQTIWIILIAYVCSFLGAFQVPAFGIGMIYGGIGLIYDMKARSHEQDVQNLTFVQQCKSLLDVEIYYNKKETPKEEPTQIPISSALEQISKSKEELNKTDSINKTNIKEEEAEYLQSDTYFKILFYACGATVFYNNVGLLILLVLPIIFYFFIHFCTSFGIKQFIIDKIEAVSNTIWNWTVTRHSALLPVCLPGILQMNRTIHLTVRDYLKSSIDVVSSIIMIILLILTVLFASIFFCVQIYSETFAVAQLGSDLINRTLTARPDLMDMLPEGFQGSMDNIVDNAHQYGRQSIETYVDDLFKDTEIEQSKKLKQQILLVWDRLIQSWLDRSGNSIGPKVPSSAITDELSEIVDNPELLSAAKQGITDWAKGNLGMIMDVMDSLWIIVRKNMYLLGSMLGTIFSVVLGGGHVVITFIVHTIIFFTALFYLLSSEEKFAGLAAIESLGFSMGTKIAEALEDSISCVVIATVKIALFHGLFTWLTHTWFGAHVVFLPAAIASVLAAAPFLGTYWCSVPAFLDLWLSQDRFYMGVLLFLVHFIIPSNFVDPTIISEIKGGGHPYLTALSIAGGMFWLGLEGAVLGPLILCLLVVIFDLTTTALRESPSFSRTPTDEKERIIADIRMSNRRHSSFQNMS